MINKDAVIKFSSVFELIKKAGGPSLPDIKKLSFSERLQVIFNVWGFLFGIIYYFHHKLIKKGLLYLAVSIVIVLFQMSFIPELDNVSYLVTCLIFATRANIDLYGKYVLNNDDKWF
jgi:hypothetical protein